MLKFQTPMSNDDVCRAMTDKQTHKHTNKHTYRVKTEETFFYLQVLFFQFSFKKAVSNIVWSADIGKSGIRSG